MSLTRSMSRSMPRLVAGLVVAGVVLVVGVSETPGQTVCATLTTTLSGQPPVQQALKLVVSSPVAGVPIIELAGQVVASGELLWGSAALLPGGGSARVGLTVSNLDRPRFMGLLIDLATAGGTGVFAQMDGSAGTATIQFGPCP